jgi:membrane protease YdiL (CAAX protease family)
MDEYPVLPERKPEHKPLIEKALAVVEVLLVSGIVSESLAFLPISLLFGKNVESLTHDVKTLSAFLLLESTITFLLLAYILKIHGERIRDMGLRWDRWKSHLFVGLALVPILFLINEIVGRIFSIYLPEYYMEQNPLTAIIHTPWQLALFIFTVLIAGGIKEELQRAFILRTFSRCLGGPVVGLVLWSLAFGIFHYVQGVQGVTVTAIIGLAFGILYLLRGSLIGPIAAHGTYDALVLLLYWLTRSQPV